MTESDKGHSRTKSYYHFKDIMSSKVAKRSGFAEKMEKLSENQTPNRKVYFKFQISNHKT